jgi:uncharacterized membrane protein YoaK (UPF0700 family)
MSRGRSHSEGGDDMSDPKWRNILSRKNSITVQMEQKPLQERNRAEFSAIIIGASLLCFNAGFINGVTLLTSDLVSSHVTGVITKSSIYLGEGNMSGFGATFSILPLFIFGSAISGVFIPYSSFHMGRAYSVIFLLGSLCLLIAVLLRVALPHSNAYVYVTVIACGMQNAMTTKYSNNILRTSHMTGAATDIGIVIGRIMVGRTDEVWRLKVLLPMMFSFFIGGLLGSQAAKKFGGIAIVFNFMIFSGTGLLYATYISNTKHITLLKAIFMEADSFVDVPSRMKRHFIGLRRKDPSKGHPGDPLSSEENGIHTTVVNPMSMEELEEQL